MKMKTRLKGARCLSRFNEHKKGTKGAHLGGTSGIKVATSSSMMELLKA